jgi:hypothetical protein
LADHAAWHARYARRKRAEVARRCALFALDGGGEHLALVVLGLRDRTPREASHLARCATRTSRLSLAIAAALAATIEAEQLASEACRAVAAAQGGAS